MYGTRSAAQDWQMEVVSTLVQAGFVQGRSSPCLFKHETRGIVTLVHGDDFVSAGTECDLQWLDQALKRKYAIKTTVIGEATHLKKELRVLNRILRWHVGKGVTLEADPRHAQILVKELEGDQGRQVTTPSVRAQKEEEETEDQKEEDIKRRRSRSTR